MASSFPTSLDSFSTLVDNVDGIVAAHPNDRGDAIENLEAKVGVNSSAVTTSHDYLLTHLPGQAQNWDAGAIEVRAETFESDVAGDKSGTGTAPMTIASSKVVTNLNADWVDGKAGPSGDIVGTTDSQTLTNKTITSPDINGGTWNGTIDGNWTAASQTCANLGAVTTADINGGTIDGVTIGAAAAPTVTNLGSVATCDINGGTVNGITSLGLSSGANITEISTDGTLGDNSDTAVPTEKAVKTYADTQGIQFSTATVFSSAAAPTSFTDLNLSGTIGSNSAVVLLRVENNGTAAWYKFRANGMADDIGYIGAGGMLAGGTSTVTVDANKSGYVLVPTDSSGIVEWIAESATTTVIHMVAYLK